MILGDAFFQALLRCSTDLGPRVVVALSGGVDLMCLAYLLSQYRQKSCKNLEILAVTVDHGYRKGSDKEAAQVGQLVRKWGLLHHLVRLQYDKDVHAISNFEEVARTGRYNAFAETCRHFGLNQLLVAHNRDDQLETYLLRLQMNSSMFGLRGLLKSAPLPVPAAGPPKTHSPVQVLRPLLDFDKNSIIETCTSNGVSWFEDATNADTNVTKRNLLRHILSEVVPERMKTDPCISVLSKEALLQTHSEVLHATDNVQTLAANAGQWLENSGLRTFSPLNGSVELSLPFWMLTDENAPVLSRLLYEQMRLVSPSPHFYWTYAKIERKAVPRLLNFLRVEADGIRTRRNTKFTYMGVLMEGTLNPVSEHLHLRLSRQPVIREEAPKIRQTLKIGESWSQHILLDNRYWIRARTSGPPLQATVDIFQNHHFAQFKSQAENMPPESTPHKTSVLHSPVITADKTILSIPTFGIFFAPLEVEWAPKSI